MSKKWNRWPQLAASHARFSSASTPLRGASVLRISFSKRLFKITAVSAKHFNFFQILMTPSKKLIQKCDHFAGFQLIDKQFRSFPQFAVRFSLFYGLRKVISLVIWFIPWTSRRTFWNPRDCRPWPRHLMNFRRRPNQVLVWFSFGKSSACTAMDHCVSLQVVQVDGAKGCGFDPRRSATFHTVDPCKHWSSLCLFGTTNVQQDHTRTGTCSAVAKLIKWDWPWAHGRRSGKFDDPYEVDVNDAMSIMSAWAATYAKRPPLVQMKASFVDRCGRSANRWTSLPWRMPGLALVRVATGLECPCMNISSISYPLAIHNCKGGPGTQRLPGPWTVSHNAKRGLWQATKENESKTINHLLRWGQEEIEKNPRRTQLACHRTAHIGHGQHVQ